MFTSFLKQSDVSHSRISDPQYKERKKEYHNPINVVWVNITKGLSDWNSEKYCESLVIVFLVLDNIYLERK